MLAFRLHQSLIPWEKPVWFLPLFMLLPAKRRRSFQALFIVYFKMTSDYLSCNSSLISCIVISFNPSFAASKTS